MGCGESGRGERRHTRIACPSGGGIVVTFSLAGIAPSVDLYYSAAKHGLIGLVRSLAMMLAAEKITVNAMCPGLFDTRLLAEHRATLIGHGLTIAAPATSPTSPPSYSLPEKPAKCGKSRAARGRRESNSRPFR